MVNRRPPSRRETNGKDVATATAEVRGGGLNCSVSSQKSTTYGEGFAHLVAIWGPKLGSGLACHRPSLQAAFRSFPCGDNAV